MLYALSGYSIDRRIVFLLTSNLDGIYGTRTFRQHVSEHLKLQVSLQDVLINSIFPF